MNIRHVSSRIETGAVLAVALSMAPVQTRTLARRRDGEFATRAVSRISWSMSRRVFFESDQTDLSPQAIATWKSRRSGCRATSLLVHHRRPRDERGTANTTSRWVRGVPNRFALLASRGIDPGRCGRSLTQGTPSRSAMTSRAGRRIAARSRS